ncbi:YtxH domain-containing protein [Bacillus sp. JJ722]|uniref:YtxH domain-containing protein n=1 Tax=Bacillus sp. JJ722 TaxID=3122973 RepID=UPI002FFD7A2C
MSTCHNKCSNKNKLLQGILLGALAGAAISLLDRHTRETTIECAKKGLRETREIIQNPDRVIGQVKETSNKIRSTIESITEDVAVITNQVEAIKDITPQLASVVKETKEAFTEDRREEEVHV